MPIRFLRPGIRQSQRWNSCDYFTQSLYIRLLTLVDDHGRYYANPVQIRNEAFPLGDPATGVIDVTAIVGALTALASKCLLTLYQVNDTEYLQLSKWQERIRSQSRFPDPVCEHLPANDSKCPPPSPYAVRLTPSPCGVADAPPEAEAKVIPDGLDTVDFKAAWADWMAFRMRLKRIKDPERMFAGQLAWLEPFGPETAAAILRQSIRNGWQGLFELKQPQGPAHANGQSGAELIVRQKELDRVEAAIAKIRAGYEAHQQMSEPDRQRLKPLKARREQLKSALGMIV